MEKSNILIVDDHPLILDGLKNLVEKTDFADKIFTATNGKIALEIIENQNIKLVITDISMPEISGVELSRIIKSKLKDIKIVILSQFEDIQIIDIA